MGGLSGLASKHRAEGEEGQTGGRGGGEWGVGEGEGS